MGEFSRTCTRSWDVGEAIGLFFLDKTSMKQPRQEYSTWWEPLSFLSALMKAVRWNSVISEFSRTSSQTVRKTVSTRKTISLEFFLCYQSPKIYILFWCRPLLYLLKNTWKAPHDFGSSQLTRTSVQWRVGLEGADDITRLFLNYTGHKLSRIFGPKAIEWFFAEIQFLKEHSEIGHIQLLTPGSFIVRDL